MSFRQLRNDSFQSTMNTGTMAVSMNGRVSHIMTPMRNTDIKRCAKSNDWSELIEKAKVQTNRFRRDFYSKGIQ
jgi:hypothetical protein